MAHLFTSHSAEEISRVSSPETRSSPSHSRTHLSQCKSQLLFAEKVQGSVWWASVAIVSTCQATKSLMGLPMKTLSTNNYSRLQPRSLQPRNRPCNWHLNWFKCMSVSRYRRKLNWWLIGRCQAWIANASKYSNLSRLFTRENQLSTSQMHVLQVCSLTS